MVEREGVAVKEDEEIAKVFGRHLKGVCNALCEEQSNVWAERSNGSIQGVETIERGYRRFKDFGSAISFLCGGSGLYSKNKGKTRIGRGH